jgi:PilZ domain
LAHKGKGRQRNAGKRQGLSKILNANYLIFGLGEWLKVGKQERRDTLVSEGAVIKFGDRTINCVVRNLSATGAAIEVPNQPGIPMRFELNIPRLGLNLS